MVCGPKAVLSGFELEWHKQRNCDSIEKCPGDLLEAPIASVMPGNLNFDFRSITQLLQ